LIAARSKNRNLCPDEHIRRTSWAEDSEIWPKKERKARKISTVWNNLKGARVASSDSLRMKNKNRDFAPEITESLDATRCCMSNSAIFSLLNRDCAALTVLLQINRAK
jgi:hypothetical protein